MCGPRGYRHAVWGPEAPRSRDAEDRDPFTVESAGYWVAHGRHPVKPSNPMSPPKKQYTVDGNPPALIGPKKGMNIENVRIVSSILR